jgi:hypothetical protein
MQRIIKNNTASPILVSDTGITIPSSGQYTIPGAEYGVWEGSSDIITYLSDQAISPGVSTLVANDGTFDLEINEGVRMIQGGFSRPISDGDDPTIKAEVATIEGVNRLRVDAIASGAGALIPTLTAKLRYDDMNASNGGVARGTSITNAAWTQVYGYSGHGLIHGFILNIETKDKWLVRFVIDNEEIFSSSGLLTNDFIADDVWDIDNAPNEEYGNIGIHFGEHDKILWGFDSLPLKFNTSVSIYLRRKAGEGSKKFRAGLMVITKEG